jgi:hypothetical protein
MLLAIQKLLPFSFLFGLYNTYFAFVHKCASQSMPDQAVVIGLHVSIAASIFLLLATPRLEHNTIEPTASTGRKLAFISFLVAHATYIALKALDELEILKPRSVHVSTEVIVFSFGNLALVQLMSFYQCYQVWRMFQNGRPEGV